MLVAYPYKGSMWVRDHVSEEEAETGIRKGSIFFWKRRDYGREEEQGGPR